MVLFGRKWCVSEPILDYICASLGREKRAVAGAVQSKGGPLRQEMCTFLYIALYRVMIEVERSGTAGVVAGTPTLEEMRDTQRARCEG